MIRGWLSRERTARRRLHLKVLAVMVPVLWIPLLVSAVDWAAPGDRPDVPAQRYVIPLAPSGTLDYPMNFGYRCTLVDSAVVLDYYGASAPQELLAIQIGGIAHYSGAARGVPWWAYVAWPGKRPLLDTAIERVARGTGLRVRAQTVLGLDFARTATAIVRNHPVILNVWRGPNGTYNHSFLAYGYDKRAGRELLLVVDPNNQVSYWIGPNTHWSATVTSTYITPAGGTGSPDHTVAIGIPAMHLFGAQRLDRVQTRGAHRGIEAKSHANHRSDAEGK